MTGQAVKKSVSFGPAETTNRESALLTLVALEQTARKATSVEQLAFIAVNETHRLIDYYQCLLWRFTPSGKVKIQSISGVSEIDQNSQAALSLQRLSRQFTRIETILGSARLTVTTCLPK